MKRRGFLKGLIASVAVVPAAVVKANKPETKQGGWRPTKLVEWKLFEEWCEAHEKHLKKCLGPKAGVIVVRDRVQHFLMHFTWYDGKFRAQVTISFNEWRRNDPVQREMLWKIRYSQSRQDLKNTQA
ncbi:hypothetical protein LCGC14_1386880 [marine sediment metagenome]|uniref:Uncharacterized protein n=1 Tax=marine sediment metagenome TaxID=412755 RepID=A0A0F9KM07_9ZZZZ